MNHDELVRQVRTVGQSIIKNAESIVGSEKMLTDLSIMVTFDRDGEPRISISREFIPEVHN